ncbi:MAG: DUF924 domain-containing protein [Candidatus Omnitrophica bacterium]|nr:DUF924 domain-containing protein [Candidatus Omnitrophota bacterium]MCK5082808.1 DUF924 domain-containing protein [Candidatus Omnitrophota bacterium]
MDKIDLILDYWFEGVSDATAIDKKSSPFKKWFIKDEQVDDEIRERFEADLTKAADGEYKDWEGSARGRLALILLYDQFSRNIYRDMPRMYAYDALALDLTLRSIDQQWDRELSLIQRTFLYMPLMHFEDPTLQQLSVKCFTGLVEESKAKIPANTHYYEYSLKYAKGHYDTVLQFGRFPHRDAILNRTGD